MPKKQSSIPKMPLKDRLGFRVAILFAATFAAVFLLGAVYSIFSAVVEKRLADAEVQVQAVAVVIDPKIQTELTKAMAFDVMPTEVAVLDPFVDRTGISNTASNLIAPVAQPALARTGAGLAGNSPAGAPRSSSIQIIPGAGTQPQTQIDAKARYDNWTARQTAGEFTGPVSEVLRISDLVPVGFVSGGDGYPEVMLYSPALCRTFTFPAGTHFSDGWLSSISELEVVFTIDRMIKRKSFSKPEPCPAETKSVGAVSSGRAEQAG